MTSARIVETLDELEHSHPRFGLRFEPAAIEKLALKRGEEALCHRIVVGVAHRTHRGPHSCLAATLAEFDTSILRTLPGGARAAAPSQGSTAATHGATVVASASHHDAPSRGAGVLRRACEDITVRYEGRRSE